MLQSRQPQMTQRTWIFSGTPFCAGFNGSLSTRRPLRPRGITSKLNSLLREQLKLLLAMLLMSFPCMAALSVLLLPEMVSVGLMFFTVLQAFLFWLETVCTSTHRKTALQPGLCSAFCTWMNDGSDYAYPEKKTSPWALQRVPEVFKKEAWTGGILKDTKIPKTESKRNITKAHNDQ